MAIISRLAVLLGLDAGEFNANLGKAKDKVEGFSLGAKASLVAVAAAFVASAKEAFMFADRINDVAKANDTSVQSVLRMSNALQLSGGSADQAGMLMAKLNNKIDEAAEGGDKAQKTFKNIGVSIQDLRTLTPDQLFEKTVISLAKIEDASKRNAMAMDIFGKSIKGVDIKGVAEELERNKTKFAGSEETFKMIAASVDRLDAVFFDLKVRLANQVAPAFDAATRSMENWIETGKRTVDRFQQIKKEAGWWSAWLDKEGLRKYEFPTRGSVQGAEVPSIMSGIGGTKGTNSIRDVKISDTLEKQNEALRQQIALYNFQAASVGMVRSEYEKLNLEFAKGGKFSDVNAKLKRDAQNAALALDKANQNDFIQGEIRKADLAKERFRIEGLMAGQSDNAKLKAREFLQIQEEILEIKRTQINISDEEIAKIAQAKIAMVEMADASRRANNTFEAGFSTAYENFKEQATDSFRVGENAFTSMTSNMESSLDNFVRTGKLSFSDLARSIIGDLIAIQLKAQALSMFEGLKGLFGFGGGGGAGMFTGATGAIGGSIHLGGKLAGGGDMTAGVPYLVGEQGPELVIPRNNGTVIPNHSLSSMMGGQPQVVYNGPYIQNMSAIDTQSGIQFLSKNKETIWSANQSAQRSLPQSR
jgi:lambda family phage tail tape measure protein